MSKYNEQVKDLLVQYEILTSELKEIYPIYKSDSTNSEIQNIYDNIQFQIQKIFSQMESISMELANSNKNEKNTMDDLNTKIQNSKDFYNTNQPKLQQIIDSNKGAVPREEEIDMSLNNKYFDLIYLLVLLGITGYSLRKLLY